MSIMHRKSRKRRKERLVRTRSIFNENTPFSVVEAYKTLRSNLQFALATVDRRIVVITSGLPQEGKSTTATNLAVAMAQVGSKVLLIDADLRKPVQHRHFKTRNTAGLSTLLSRTNTLKEVIIQNVRENLDLILSGPIPPNPSELLASKAMDELLDEAYKDYQYILIDSPPINVVTDALVTAKDRAGILFVARQSISTYDQVRRAMDSIQFADIKLLGSVLTNVVENKRLYGKNKRKYYYKNYYSH